MKWQIKLFIGFKLNIKPPYDWVAETYCDEDTEAKAKLNLDMSIFESMPGVMINDVSLGFQYKRFDIDKFIIIYGPWRQDKNDKAYKDLLLKIFPKQWHYLKFELAKKLDKDLGKLFGIERVETFFGPLTPLREPAISFKIKDGVHDPLIGEKLYRVFELLKKF